MKITNKIKSGAEATSAPAAAASAAARTSDEVILWLFLTWLAAQQKPKNRKRKNETKIHCYAGGGGRKRRVGAQKGFQFFSLLFCTRCAGAEHNDSAWARAKERREKDRARGITQLICLFVLIFRFPFPFVAFIHRNNAICHALIHAEARGAHILMHSCRKATISTAMYVIFIPFATNFCRFKFIYCFLIIWTWISHKHTHTTYIYIRLCMYSFIVIDNAARIGTDDG